MNVVSTVTPKPSNAPNYLFPLNCGVCDCCTYVSYRLFTGYMRSLKALLPAKCISQYVYCTNMYGRYMYVSHQCKHTENWLFCGWFNDQTSLNVHF